MSNKKKPMGFDAYSSIMAINPFPFIFKTKFDFKFKEKKKDISKLMEITQFHTEEQKLVTPEKGGGFTSAIMGGATTEGDDGEIIGFPCPHEWNSFDGFNEWVSHQIDTIWDVWKLIPQIPKGITESWINKHPPGAWTSAHHHQGVNIAAACYLNVPENGGGLLVRNPLQIYKYSEPIRPDYYGCGDDLDNGMDWELIPVETNDVLFFPGWLWHKTQVNNNENGEDRYVMSCNIRHAPSMR